MRKLALWLALACLATLAHAQDRAPVFDVHLHALSAADAGPPPVAMCTPMASMPTWDPTKPYVETWLALLKNPPCDDPMWSPATDAELLQRTLEVVERYNVYGVLSGTRERVAKWVEAAPGRFMTGLQFRIGRENYTPERVRELYESGAFQVLAEVTNQYDGIAPDDERMGPFWALAEELDVPVGLHVGPGPPGVIYLGSAGYRARLHSALTVEEVLVKHPRLRLYLMHAGYPMLDDTLALMYSHPQVYVGTGVIVFTQPRAAFYRFLRGLVEAGFGQRVLFGSDQMVWPDAIERSIRVIEEAPFLSEAQKRDILYDNAARFFRISEEEQARQRNPLRSRGAADEGAPPTTVPGTGPAPVPGPGSGWQGATYGVVDDHNDVLPLSKPSSKSTIDRIPASWPRLIVPAV